MQRFYTLKFKYSATNTLKIVVISEMVLKSSAVMSSFTVCHITGKGREIKCKARTPRNMIQMH